MPTRVRAATTGARLTWAVAAAAIAAATAQRARARPSTTARHAAPDAPPPRAPDTRTTADADPAEAASKPTPVGTCARSTCAQPPPRARAAARRPLLDASQAASDAASRYVNTRAAMSGGSAVMEEPDSSGCAMVAMESTQRAALGASGAEYDPD